MSDAVSFIDSILAEDLADASKILQKRLAEITRVRLEAIRSRIALRTFVTEKHYLPTTRRIGRLNFVRIRVRKGKVQRRKKVSAVKGWTFRHGKMLRMRPSERLHRRLGARRAKIKRRSKISRIRRKTAISMRRRRSLGLSYKAFGR